MAITGSDGSNQKGRTERLIWLSPSMQVSGEIKPRWTSQRRRLQSRTGHGPGRQQVSLARRPTPAGPPAGFCDVGQPGLSVYHLGTRCALYRVPKRFASALHQSGAKLSSRRNQRPAGTHNSDAACANGLISRQLPSKGQPSRPVPWSRTRRCAEYMCPSHQSAWLLQQHRRTP